MPAAYILIDLNMSVDFAESLRDLRGIDGVSSADLVVGPDDCIAYVEAADSTQMMNTIRAIRNVAGVSKTDTRSIAEV
ncbi:MAG: Lrp/AsnC ligand binding domain-containing protein [Chloroflexi bacterium]|nr:Lrp/AsnC ligand binding domain-containing protein [Chloroflexota bacterium]